jgi:hypothetical protein
MMPRMTTLTADNLGRIEAAFARLVATLCGFVAVRGGRDPSVTGLVLLLHGRVSRIRQRFTRLVAKLMTGWRPAALAPRAPRTDARVREAQARLPSGSAWLFHLLKHEAAAARAHLEQVLADPAMQAVLAEVPAAGRLMRPMCRMLGVKSCAEFTVPGIGEAKPRALAPAPKVAGDRVVAIGSLGWVAMQDGRVVPPDWLTKFLG